MSNTDPGRFFQTAPSLIPRLPLPVQVRVPAFSTVRGPRPRRVLDVIALAPASTVLPVPIIDPPAQVNGPATVSVPAPVIAVPPPVSVRLSKVTSAATVSKPLLAARRVPGPTPEAAADRVCAPSKLRIPPLPARKAPELDPAPPPMRSVPARASTVPALLRVTLRFVVPVPPDLRTVPALLNCAAPVPPCKAV